MKQEHPVPKLDLAPKLKRPLSLWNPLDYLRLLYWVFYFPQALRWYIDTFGGGYIEPSLMNWGQRWKLRLQNPIQRNLQIQELLSIFFIPLILYGLLLFKSNLEELAIFFIVGSIIFGLLFNLIWDIGLGIAGGVTFGVIFGVVFGGVFDAVPNVVQSVALTSVYRVALGVAFSAALGVAYSAAYSAALNVVLGETSVIVLSVTLSVALGVAFGAALDVALDVAFGVVLGVAFGVAFGVVYRAVYGIIFRLFSRGLTNAIVLTIAPVVVPSVVLIVVNSAVYSVVPSVALGVVLLRLEDWLITIFLNLIKSRSSVGKIAHVTLLPDYSLIDKLQTWLQKDWAIGISNVNQILKYTLQLAHVVPPIKRVLLEFPDQQVIYRVNQLVEGTNNWKLIRSLVKFDSEISSFATTNGFWYLHEKQPDRAKEAFSLVRNLLYGEEVFILAQTLNMFQQAKEVNEIANLTIPNFPKENLLRPATWQTINSLRRVVEDIKLIQHSASRNTKSLAYSRAIGELTEVINNQEQILVAERALIVDIAQTWKQALERIGKEIGDVAITKPVVNPYVIGNPVTGSLFVGREDIIRQLEELWIMGNQLQSVVLYGHRRMGKTSILVNIAKNTGAEIKVIYLNLQRLGAVSQGVAEVLIAISDALAKQLKIESPGDEEFLSLPQRTFERYLEQVIENMNYRGLIIALDEFETIEELIELGQLDPRFMGFLRGLIQINPAKLAFVFAGLHTLEEMTADYFEPFFASVIPINVGFISEGATRNLLANPIPIPPFIRGGSALGGFPDLKQLPWARGDQTMGDQEHDFILDYTREALDLIYSLTLGQPYLIQLIGFQLVRNYNDRVFEQNKSRDPIFTVEDVAAVVSQNFFQQGRYYFEGVWGQASQGAPAQHEILIVLAPYPQGITKDKLITQTGLDPEQLSAAIDTLKRHDVISEQEDCYRIIVELFRRWVIMSQE